MHSCCPGLLRYTGKCEGTDLFLKIFIEVWVLSVRLANVCSHAYQGAAVRMVSGESFDQGFGWRKARGSH